MKKVNRQGSKGQMRVIEVILASIMVVSAIIFLYYFSAAPASSTYEIGDLEKIGHNVLHNIDEQQLLGRYIFNSEWFNLQAALTVSLPTDVYFNLTVYDLNGNQINNVPIGYGSSQVFETSKAVASVTYIVSGYQTNYNPKLLQLQLVRG